MRYSVTLSNQTVTSVSNGSIIITTISTDVSEMGLLIYNVHHIPTNIKADIGCRYIASDANKFLRRAPQQDKTDTKTTGSKQRQAHGGFNF